MARIGIISDQKTFFTRLLYDGGHIPEEITPQFLAAPHFRRKYAGLVIPAGFTLKMKGPSLLQTLRACSGRLNGFVRSGGALLIFGGGSDCPNAYDWINTQITYQFGFEETSPAPDPSHFSGSITEPDKGTVSIDGTLRSDTGIPILISPAGVIGLSFRIGEGVVVILTLHEYPAASFLAGFFNRESEIIF